MHWNDPCTPSRAHPEAETRAMRPGRRGFLLGTAAAATGLALAPSAFAISRQDFNVSASWAAAPVSAAPAAANRIAAQTIRQIVHLSVGGDAVRVRLSNRYGTAPLVVTAAAIGLADGAANIVGGPARLLRFSGRSFFTIPAYGELYSDWISWSVPNASDLAIDLYIASDTSAGTSPLTLHDARPRNQVLSYIAAGNVVGSSTFPTVDGRAQWYFLTGVDVSNGRSPGSVCCFGDSITDGSGSTLNTNTRYPDQLAAKLLAASPTAPMGVANLGIGGGRVLSGGVGDSALARFDRDVLALGGVWNIIVLEGINDLNGGFTAARIIEGQRQLVRRAHAKGKKIFGATVTPYGFATDFVEAERQTLNAFIRTGGAYDGVFDFDAAVRDPSNPRVMQAIYDSGDSLHPNSAGYAAFVAAIDPALFAGARPRIP